MSPVLERLSARQQDRIQAAIERRNALSKALADGAPVDLDDAEIEELLTLTGWSVSDLQRDVQRLQGRASDRQVIVDADELKRGKSAIENGIANANAELEEAKRKHQQTIWILNQKLREIHDAATESRAAQQRLRESISEEDADRIHTAQIFVNVAEQEHSEAYAIVQTMETKLKSPAELRNPAMGGWRRDGEQPAEQARQLGPGFQPKLAAARERLRKAADALETARERLKAATDAAMAN